VPVALAAYRLGPLWGLLAALPVTAYRVSLGGPALPGTLLHLLLVLLAATSLRHPDAVPTLRLRENLRRSVLIFSLPALSVFIAFLASGRPASDAVAPYLLVTVLSVLGFNLWYGVVRLMAQSFERASRFETVASIDQLTGLPNRYAFDSDHKSTATWTDRYLLFLDLDRFKALNDRYGHEFGDQVLRAFGRVAARQIGTVGRAYRLGGEEFVVRFVAAETAKAHAGI